MIKNKRNGEVLAKKHTKICSIFGKARGLMFSRPRTLVFEFRSAKKVALHMFFVFFAIDVAFLDSKYRIVEMKGRFRPFTVYNPTELCSYIIEMPAGTFDSTNTRIGDTIIILDDN